MKHIALGVLLTVATLLVGTNMATAQTAQSCYVFNNDLSQGMTFGEVLELQKFLASEGSFVADVNGTFGPLTKAALARYQSKNGILATGYFGPATRARVNSRCGEVLGEFTSTDIVPYAPVTTKPASTGTRAASLTLLTPVSGDTWQLGNNSHRISWSPNPESATVSAYLEKKKGKVFDVVGKIIQCEKGSIIWCGGWIDTTPNDGTVQHTAAKPGSYYLSITDSATGQTARTNNPIKLVKYGEVVKLKLKAHLDKNKGVDISTSENAGFTPITVKERKVVLSWNSNAKVDSCTVEISGIENDGSYGLAWIKDLPRHVTKRTFDLPESYGKYEVIVRCADDSNVQQGLISVTVAGASQNVAPRISHVQAKAAEQNELYADEDSAVLYGKNLNDATRVYLDLGDENYYFVSSYLYAQPNQIQLHTPEAGEVPDGEYVLYAQNGDAISNGIRVVYKNPVQQPPLKAVRDFRWVVNNTGTIIDFFFTVQAEDADFQVPSSRITPTSMGTAVISGPFLSLSTGDADTITPGSSYVVRDGDEATFRVRFTLAGENGAYGEIRMASVLGQGVPQELQVSPTATISLASAGGGVAGAFAANTATYGPYSAIAGLPDLKAGMTHEGVAVIQRFLNANGFVVSTTSGQPGSVGYEATYFGPATQRALAAYQASKGISSTGTFGPATRAAMASTQN